MRCTIIFFAAFVAFSVSSGEENIVSIFAGRGVPNPFEFDVDASLEDGTALNALIIPGDVQTSRNSSDAYVLDFGQAVGSRILKFTASGLASVLIEDSKLNLQNPNATPVFISRFAVSNSGVVYIAFSDGTIRTLGADNSLTTIAGKVDSTVKVLNFDQPATDTVFPRGVQQMRFDSADRLHILFGENVIGRIDADGVLRRVVGTTSFAADNSRLPVSIDLNNALNSVLPSNLNFDISPLDGSISFVVSSSSDELISGIFTVKNNTITPISAKLNGQALGVPFDKYRRSIGILSDGTIVAEAGISFETALVSIAPNSSQSKILCGLGTLFEGPATSCHLSSAFISLAIGQNNQVFIMNDFECCIKLLSLGTLSLNQDTDRDGFGDSIESIEGTETNSELSKPRKYGVFIGSGATCVDFQSNSSRVKLVVEDLLVSGSFVEGDQLALIFNDSEVKTFSAINEKHAVSFKNGRAKLIKKKIKSINTESATGLISFDFSNKDLSLVPDNSLNILVCYLTRDLNAECTALRIPIVTKGDKSSLMRVTPKRKTSVPFNVEKPDRGAKK